MAWYGKMFKINYEDKEPECRTAWEDHHRLCERERTDWKIILLVILRKTEQAV
jgi:hypothetical protein